MDQNNNSETTTPNTKFETAKKLAVAIAPAALFVGFGIACGIVVEKIKNRTTEETTEI